MSPDTSHDQHVVTAVIVAHDGAAWLPRLIDSLQNQTRPLQRVVAVDTGSRDRSGAMLVQVLGRGAVFGMDRGTGYAAAVAQALRHRAAASRVPGGHDERVEWVWLLHDDCEPAPDALAELLRGADEVPAAAVLGPKVMDWNDQRMILEAGVTIDRVGRRITGLEPREVDQGQHDGDRDVVAVSTAGMLVRRDVWDYLRGFDPGFQLFREDVDFCWRVQATGFRVRLVTDAVVYHLEASARNRRATSAAPRPRRQDRRGALLALLANLPAGPMLAATVGNTVLSLLRAMFYLLAKRAGDGMDELAALASVVGHPFRLLGARNLRARGRRNAYGRLRADLPPGRTLQRLAEFLANAMSSATTTDTIGSHHATDDPSEDDSLLTDSGFAQRVLTNPGVLLVLGLSVVALVAERSLLGGGPLGGGNLTPAWGGASALWQEYLQGFHPAGLGSAASAPPWVALMALLSTLLGGKPWLAVDVLLLGCVPLAGLTAFQAARRVTALMPVRVWVAAVYALLPVGMGAVAAGRLGTAVMFVLLPAVGLLVARIFTASPRRARRAAWAAALVTAVAAAFVPLTWIAVAVLTGAGALLAARTRKPAGLNLAIVTVVPPLLLLPWSAQVATQPLSVFLEAGLSQPGLAQAGLSGKFLLLLSPGGPGLPPYWVTGGLLLAAALTVVLAGSRPLVRVGWAIALTGLLIAAGASRLVITPPTGGAPVAAWPGPVLALAGAGLLMSVAAAGDLLQDRLAAGRWRNPAGAALIAVAVAATAGPALGLASWVAKGVQGPVAVVRNQVLPEFVAVSADTGLRQRTLVLRAGRHGAISYEVLRDTDPLLGTGQLAMPPDAQRVLTRAVASLAAPGGSAVQDQGRNLAQLGIGYVLMPSPASPGVARLLDGVAGLRPVSQTPAFRLWRVTGTAARITVVQPGGKVVPVASGTVGASGVALPRGGGELLLAEPAGGWSASVNGQPLTPLSSPVGGWAQGFRLPAGGGRLTLGHSQLGRDLLVALEALAVLVVAGLGLPGAKSAAEGAEQLAAGRQERQPARRARDGVPRGGEPGTAPPGTAQPGRAQPGRAQPETAGPGAAGPGAVPAAAGEPETSAWRTGRRGQRRGRVAEPMPAEPGSAEPGSARPGSDEPGRAEPAPAGPLATGRAAADALAGAGLPHDDMTQAVPVATQAMRAAGAGTGLGRRGRGRPDSAGGGEAGDAVPPPGSRGTRAASHPPGEPGWPAGDRAAGSARTSGDVPPGRRGSDPGSYPGSPGTGRGAGTGWGGDAGRGREAGPGGPDGGDDAGNESPLGERAAGLARAAARRGRRGGGLLGLGRSGRRPSEPEEPPAGPPTESPAAGSPAESPTARYPAAGPGYADAPPGRRLPGRGRGATSDDRGRGATAGGPGPGSSARDRGDGSGARDRGRGSGAWDRGDGSGARDRGRGSGAWDRGDGSGAWDSGQGAGARDRGQGGGAWDRRRGSSARDRGEGSGAWGRGEGSSARDRGEGSGAWDRGQSGRAWGRGEGSSARDRREGSGAWERGQDGGAWDRRRGSSARDRGDGSGAWDRGQGGGARERGQSASDWDRGQGAGPGGPGRPGAYGPESSARPPAGPPPSRAGERYGPGSSRRARRRGRAQPEVGPDGYPELSRQEGQGPGGGEGYRNRDGAEDYRGHERAEGYRRRGGAEGEPGRGSEGGPPGRGYRGPGRRESYPGRARGYPGRDPAGGYPEGSSPGGYPRHGTGDDHRAAGSSGGAAPGGYEGSSRGRAGRDRRASDRPVPGDLGSGGEYGSGGAGYSGYPAGGYSGGRSSGEYGSGYPAADEPGAEGAGDYPTGRYPSREYRPGDYRVQGYDPGDYEPDRSQDDDPAERGGSRRGWPGRGRSRRRDSGGPDR